MGYVILQVAVSLDGYISRKDHSVDFLETIDPSFQNHFTSFIDSIDFIIMGSKTYDVMLKFGDIPFKDKNIYVLTKRTYESTNENIIFTEMPIKGLTDELSGNIWLFGGASVIQSFMKNNLVDELQLYIVPKTIGDGIPLFYEHNQLNNWKLISHEKFSDNLYVIYKKQK
ncbi:dihydrofolate reductase family protein [Mariniplasma anaerobium]|uniref:Diacylglycerol kinase n=1 Tax=Mariniplasma anaerobium TaxID=2735436 RepID=A0A7U9XUJ0_9MOLU|nr:dihydrofolate reductase [Mariniplasma anaerobium]BCR35825.1 diacylglycerol kinase [Mariniplasma anaerobium]